MRQLARLLSLVFLCHFATAVTADAGTDNVLVQMFAWWNEAIKDPNGFSEEAFRRYYTEDSAIIINGIERVRGIKPLVAHFKKIQQAVDYVEIVLPFEEGFESGNRIFTYHRVRAKAEGREEEQLVMGYAVIEEGKIALADFLSYDAPRTKH